MALLIEKVTDKGVVAGYWKISSWTLNKNGNSPTSTVITYNISGYYNKEAKDMGCGSLQDLQYSFYLTDITSLIIYKQIFLSWNNGVLGGNFSHIIVKNYETLSIPLKDLCSGLIKACYAHARTTALPDDGVVEVQDTEETAAEIGVISSSSSGQ